MAHQPSGTTTDANVVVYQFGAAWGLPSLEPASLAAQTYARFSSKADRVRFVDCNNPRISAAGELPVVYLPSVDRFVQPSDTLAALKCLCDDVDQDTTMAQQNDLFALSYLIETKLHLCMLQNWWADDENFDKVTRVEYGNIMPFPLNYTMPHRMRKSVLDKLEAAKLLKRKQAVNTARKCYQVLATRLGENQYFFNDKPSALDAIVFAHLALQLYAPMPHAYLSEELQKFGSLVRYCESILQSAFGIVPPILKPTETTAESDQQDEESLRSRALQTAGFAAAVVGLFVVTYRPDKVVELIHAFRGAS